jgi:hypothetical protein
MKSKLFCIEMIRSLKMPPFGNLVTSTITVEISALSLDDALAKVYTQLPSPWEMSNCFESKELNAKANGRD